MSTQSWVIIGIVAAVVVAIAIGLGMSLAMDGDGMHGDGNPFFGMSGAMHDGDMDDMMSHMSSVMSDEDFATMQAHMQAHQAGSSMMHDGNMDALKTEGSVDSGGHGWPR